MTKSFSDRVAEGKANHGTITPAELKAKMDANEEVTVVDVRDASALGEGVIPDCQRTSRLERCSTKQTHKAPSMTRKHSNPDQPIVFTCAGGGQASIAASVLAEYGFTNVTILEGGTRGWSAEGLPTEKVE